MNHLLRVTVLLSIVAVAAFAAAQPAQVIGGSTSVALDTAALSSAAGLTLSGVSPGIGGGSLPSSVAFPINLRTAATLPTTFAYTPGNFPGGPFSGSIEHTGSVFFNTGTVEVGNFTIGFDGARAGGAKSGFFVKSNVGVSAILFDAGVKALDAANASTLDLTVDLLVSPEFASFLGNTGLTGADVGDARIVAVVPEPAAFGLVLALLAGAGWRRV